MKKATCLLLSLLVFATPLYATKDAIYDKYGKKIGYIEKVNGQIYLYNEYGIMVERNNAYGKENSNYKKLVYYQNKYPSRQAKLCPLPYCQSINIQTVNTYSKSCKECGYSLENVPITNVIMKRSSLDKFVESTLKSVFVLGAIFLSVIIIAGGVFSE